MSVPNVSLGLGTLTRILKLRGSASTAGASGQSSDKMPAFAVNAASFGVDFVVQESA